MKTYSAQQLPWPTSNAALAFCLYVGGVPFQDDTAPLTNIYDAEVLRHLGYRGNIEENAIEAFTRGEKGIVQYGFAHANNLEEGIKAFNGSQKAADASSLPAEALVGVIIKNHSEGLLSSTEALAGAANTILRRWRTELKDWETNRDFSAQRNRHVTKHYDGRMICEKMFLAGFFPFAAAVLDTRAVFLNLFKNYPPLIRLRRKGELQKVDDKVRSPGFAIYSESAQRSTRRHLDIPPK